MAKKNASTTKRKAKQPIRKKGIASSAISKTTNNDKKVKEEKTSKSKTKTNNKTTNNYKKVKEEKISEAKTKTNKKSTPNKHKNVRVTSAPVEASSKKKKTPKRSSIARKRAHSTLDKDEITSNTSSICTRNRLEREDFYRRRAHYQALGIKGKKLHLILRTEKKVVSKWTKQKKYKKNGSGPKKYTIRLPPETDYELNAQSIQNVPWMNNNSIVGAYKLTPDHCTKHTTKDSTAIQILPKFWYTLSSDIIQNFDEEVTSFASYVTLTMIEIEARQYMIDHFQEISDEKQSFERDNNKLEGHIFQSQEKIQVLPFGSFTSLQVSTFESDVDVAIWGAVPVQNKDPTISHASKGNHVRFDAENFLHDDSDKEDEFEQNNFSGKRMTISSMQKTLEALGSSTTSNHEVKKENGVIQNNDHGATGDGDILEKETRKRAKTMKWAKVLEEGTRIHKPQDQIIPDDKNSSLNWDENLRAKPSDALFVIDRTGASLPDENEVLDEGKTIKHNDVKGAKHEGVKEDSESTNEIVCNIIHLKDKQSSNSFNEEFDFIIKREGATEFGADGAERKEVRHKDTSKDNLEVGAKNSCGNIANDGTKECQQSTYDKKYKLQGDVIQIDLTSDNSEENDSQFNDVDSADKMESFKNSYLQSNDTNANSSNENGSHSIHQKATQNSNLSIDLCFSTSSSDNLDESNGDNYDPEFDDGLLNSGFSSFINNDKLGVKPCLYFLSAQGCRNGDSCSYSHSLNDNEDRNIEISCTNISSQPTLTSTKTLEKMGPSGDTRLKVLKALRYYHKRLGRSDVVQTTELRRHARVPIINLTTQFGFECDICLGGHNGTDTSTYASSQVSRYRSFGPVILVLKILLSQADLDKPFTGGLGSYKLYVLVSYHLEKHLALGGIDRPMEVLLSFFYRFGDSSKQKVINDIRAFTTLNQRSLLFADGGEADLSAVFKIDVCSKLFGLCFNRLIRKIELRSKGVHVSLLESIVDSAKLISKRKLCLNKSNLVVQYKKKQRDHFISRFDTGKVTPSTKKVGHIFSKSDAGNGSLSRVGKRSVVNLSKSAIRSKRGSLIPKQRPDLDAKHADKNVLIGRAKKNRKNKKKQNRDRALVEFAFSEC